MNIIKKKIVNAKGLIKNTRLDLHFRRELNNVEKQSHVEVKSLDSEMARQVRGLFGEYGFNNIDLRWHEYLYAVTGKLYTDYIPENFYHCVIEPLYTRGSVDLEDKGYMHRMLPKTRMVPNIIKNVKGVFLDENDCIVSEEAALKMLCALNTDLIIKPSRQTGGGTGVQLVNSAEFDKSKFDEYGQDYIIQKCIVQHPQYSQFNPSSVNTEKIISFLFKGKVYILTSILRVGAPGAHTDTASTGRGYTIGIQSNGQLNEVGYNIFGERRTEDVSGRKFSNIKLFAHEKICQEIKKAHLMLPRFEVISWDFAVDESGEPILIEFNLNYPDVMIYQMNNGPLFGDLTEAVLRDAAQRIKTWRKK